MTGATSGAASGEWIEEARKHPPRTEDWATLLYALHCGALQDKTRGTDGADGLLVAVWELQAIVTFLMRQEHFKGGSENLAPLMRLVGAMQSLAIDGRLAPMLKPKPTAGKPGNLGNTGAIKGFAARAMSELIAGGMEKDNAARKVASALTAASAGRKRVQARTVENWRERAMQAEYGDVDGCRGIMRHAYWKLPGDLAGKTPAERAAAILQDIQRYAGLMDGLELSH